MTVVTICEIGPSLYQSYI